MKKKNILFGIVCVSMLFALTGCGNKTAITTNQFKSIAESHGYTTYDVTNQYTSNIEVQEATVAKSPDGFQIEFYFLNDPSAATSMFNTNKSTFETYKGNASAQSSTSIGNYSRYSLTSDGYYMHICRVDNTLLYVRVNDTHKSSVKDLIKELGY